MVECGLYGKSVMRFDRKMRLAVLHGATCNLVNSSDYRMYFPTKSLTFRVYSCGRMR